MINCTWSSSNGPLGGTTILDNPHMMSSLDFLFLSRLYPSERKQLLLFSAWRLTCSRHTPSVWKPYRENKRRDPEPMLFRKGPDFPLHCGIFGCPVPFKSAYYTPQSEFLRWPELRNLKLSLTPLRGQLNGDWKFYDVCVSFRILNSI